MAHSAFLEIWALRTLAALGAVVQLCSATALADDRGGVTLSSRLIDCRTTGDTAAKMPSALDRISSRQNIPTGASPASAASLCANAVDGGVEGEADEIINDARSLLGGGAVASRRAAMFGGSGAVLGSVAVPVRRTAYDARWARVDAAAPIGMMRGALAQAGVAAGMREAELISRVNRWVNHHVQYQSDTQLFQQRDYWATASETLANKAGDCEDYAVLKMQMLRAAGVPSSRLKLMLLRDLAANADHAFLLVSTGAGDQILDNLVDRIVNARDMTAVRPIISFSGERRWLHALPDRGAAMMAQANPRAGVAG